MDIFFQANLIFTSSGGKTCYCWNSFNQIFIKTDEAVWWCQELLQYNSLLWWELSLLWDIKNSPHKQRQWIKLECKTWPQSPITIDETFAVAILEAVMTHTGFRALIKDDLATVLWHYGASVPVAIAWLLPTLLPMHASHILPAQSYFQSLLHLLSLPVI